MNFNAYTIGNVRKEGLDPELFWLHFTINHFHFKMAVSKTKEGYKPKNVLHEKRPYNRCCPVCRSTMNTCNRLKIYNEEFLAHLVKQPALRLRWLLSHTI